MHSWEVEVEEVVVEVEGRGKSGEVEEGEVGEGGRGLWRGRSERWRTKRSRREWTMADPEHKEKDSQQMGC